MGGTVSAAAAAYVHIQGAAKTLTVRHWRPGAGRSAVAPSAAAVHCRGAHIVRYTTDARAASLSPPTVLAAHSLTHQFVCSAGARSRQRSEHMYKSATKITGASYLHSVFDQSHHERVQPRARSQSFNTYKINSVKKQGKSITTTAPDQPCGAASHISCHYQRISNIKIY